MMQRAVNNLLLLYRRDNASIKVTWKIRHNPSISIEDVLGYLSTFIEDKKLEPYCEAPRILQLNGGRRAIAIKCSRRVARILVHCVGVIELYVQ